MKLLVLFAPLFLSACATQLDLNYKEGDISIVLVEVDAEAAIPMYGGVEADGCWFIARGVDARMVPKLRMTTPDCTFGIDD